MKDTLILQDKIYISARRAAEISGYTSDYVGQLCRAGKLVCKMVGRSWFVSEESFKAHCASIDKALDNSVYISAKEAAEISGYSADYIGQLCRAQKLVCKMVGRSWFVTEESLKAHCALSDKTLKQKSEIIIASDEAKISLPQINTNQEIYHHENISFVPEIFSLPKLISQSFVASPAIVKTQSFIFNPAIKLFVGSYLLIFIFAFLIQSSLINIPTQSSQTASILSTSEFAIRKVISFFTSLPEFAMNIFNPNSKVITKEIDKPPPEFNGLAVAPSTNSVSQDEIIKQKIKNSFSDEVKVKPDQSGTAGIITPVFKKAKGDDFLYVLVPVNNKNQ